MPSSKETKKNQLSKLIVINVPISKCNLRCHYCYISQRNEWEKNNDPTLKYSPEFIGRAFSAERLGGRCLVNLTGIGETLILPEMPRIIYELLKQGHFLEVVTNATLTKRFDEIVQLPKEYLERLEFKCSFHYSELKEKGLLDVFFENVNRMRKAGASVTVELMPNDEIVEEIPAIKALCMERLGALCHLTVGRDENNRKDILSKMSYEEYVNTWSQFDSPMFDFKLQVLNKERKEFCYAGEWSLYVNLFTGEARQCYGCLSDQNIYANVDKPIKFRPIGKKCKQPFCYNAHAFLSLGMIPELETPSYLEMRDRVDSEGAHWFSEQGRAAFETKLNEVNEPMSSAEKIKFVLTGPVHGLRIVKSNYKKVLKKAGKKMKK